MLRGTPAAWLFRRSLRNMSSQRCETRDGPLHVALQQISLSLSLPLSPSLSLLSSSLSALAWQSTAAQISGTLALRCTGVVLREREREREIEVIRPVSLLRTSLFWPSPWPSVCFWGVKFPRIRAPLGESAPGTPRVGRRLVEKLPVAPPGRRR